MNIFNLLGPWLGLEGVDHLESVRPSFGAAWAHRSPFLVLLGVVSALLLAGGFYARMQSSSAGRLRWFLAGLRGTTLALLILMIADPILEVTLVRYPQPVLWVGVDSSDSMAIRDDLSPEQREPLDSALGLGAKENPAAGSLASEALTRADYARAFLTQQGGAWYKDLASRFRIKTFALTTDRGVVPLDEPAGEAPSSSSGEPPSEWWNRWEPTGSVTALGDSLLELGRRQQSQHLAGVLLISDFDQNAGQGPLAAAKRLGVPIFTLGVGPESAADLSVDLLAPPTMKKAESSTLVVTVRQRELERTPVTVRLWAERPAASMDTAAERQLIGERSLVLGAATQTVDFPHIPDAAGRFVFVAEVDALPTETITQNNRISRDVRVIDDFLRLFFVEYEPTWEWRFVKEVFHRDKLVGTRGFRTFLRSADPVVRQTNELFVSSLTLPRSEFFEADVIFLGDLPASALSTRFCEMTREFVDQFGGGLVVLGGPRFGPGQLAETPLADMLPVVVDPDARLRDDREFTLQLTPLAARYDFMRLGRSGTPVNAAADTGFEGWKRIGKIPWYRPVQRVDPRASVLAEHPSDLCADGKTKQPLIAVRPYGRGEVVYLAFNELWRLRRLSGEEHYRQFWGQLIHRLGLSHALGDQKRFVARTDKRQYRSGDQAVLTVEAYNADFEPLSEDRVPDRRLSASWMRPVTDDQGQRTQETALPALRPGVFETRLTVAGEGEHRVRVLDPVTGEYVEVAFLVADISIERRNPVRNTALQESLASETGGRAYDLINGKQFLQDFQPPRPRETSVEVIPLWSTWLTFLALLTLLMLEWTGRKAVNLS